MAFNSAIDMKAIQILNNNKGHELVTNWLKTRGGVISCALSVTSKN